MTWNQKQHLLQSKDTRAGMLSFWYSVCSLEIFCNDSSLKQRIKNDLILKAISCTVTVRVLNVLVCPAPVTVSGVWSRHNQALLQMERRDKWGKNKWSRSNIRSSSGLIQHSFLFPPHKLNLHDNLKPHYRKNPIRIFLVPRLQEPSCSSVRELPPALLSSTNQRYPHKVLLPLNPVE